MNDTNSLFYCKLTANHYYSLLNLPGIKSEFSVCNTRWSCDHAAGSWHAVWHAAVAAFTNSICMRNTRNTAGWSDCRPLCITTLLLVFDSLFFFPPLCAACHWRTNVWRKWRKEKNKTTFETFNFCVMCFRDFNCGASEDSEGAVSCSRISLFHETERLWWNSPDAAHCVTISTIDLAVTGWFMWDRMTVSCLLYPGRPCALSLPLEVKQKPFLHCHKWILHMPSNDRVRLAHFISQFKQITWKQH